MQQPSIRTLVLEFVDTNGASHIRQMHIEILRVKPGTPEHTIRARLTLESLTRMYGDILSILGAIARMKAITGSRTSAS